MWLIGLEADRHWPRLARAVGHPEWIDDPKYATVEARREHCVAIVTELDEILATRTREEWAVALDAEDVWWAPVQDLDEVLVDPQLWASGGFVEVPDGSSTATMVASPVDFSDTPWAPRAMAPELGQHTDEILRELGRDPASIASLRAEGVVA